MHGKAPLMLDHPATDERRGWEEEVAATKRQQAISSLTRVGVPTVAAAVVGFLYFDEASRSIASALDGSTVARLAQDNESGQFVQNFLLVIDILFAILAGNTYRELYEQQEEIYMALYIEVSTAKSLLEQLTLVGQGRAWYPAALRAMEAYVSEDLRPFEITPTWVVTREGERRDPLETILFLTSVGVPSNTYDSVRDLRTARGARLGASQRKFPLLGITLLYVLAGVELFSFPLLGAGTAQLSELPEAPLVSILELQATLFAALCGAIILVLRIIQELWQKAGGVFNIDGELQIMVFGLEEELRQRLAGTATGARAEREPR